MIESVKVLVKEMADNPVTTVVAATTTTTAGFINRFFSDLPYIHELLGDLSMVCGIVACLALARLHYIKGNAEQLKNDEFIRSLRDKNNGEPD
jgi:predicted RND superfamily exporter protein